MEVIKIVIKFRPCKLQRGSTSFILPLPPAWINSVGIRKGDVLNIETDDDESLRIFPIPKSAQCKE
jgi:hypothetical protein